MTHSPKSNPVITRATIILCLISILGIAIMPWLGEIGSADHKSPSATARWITFLGEFHPVFLHLPIGVLILVFIMEMGSILSRGKYQPHTTLALAFASITAIGASIFGYCLYLTGDFTTDLAEEHKRDGIIFTILLIITFLIRLVLKDKPHHKALTITYRTFLTLTTIIMIAASHHGGEMTHGDPLKKAPWNTPSKTTSLNPNTIIYTDIVHPILEEKCISCHGPEKQKSGLRMDTYAYLLEGGDEEECLVPGSLEKSYMITTLHLPLDDDLRMPPEDKPQLTPEEIKILEWWVKSGAPEKTTLGETNTPPNILKALQTLKD